MFDSPLTIRDHLLHHLVGARSGDEPSGSSATAM
jgi:hypothetical protein